MEGRHGGLKLGDGIRWDGAGERSSWAKETDFRRASRVEGAEGGQSAAETEGRKYACRCRSMGLASCWRVRRCSWGWLAGGLGVRRIGRGGLLGWRVGPWRSGSSKMATGAARLRGWRPTGRGRGISSSAGPASGVGRLVTDGEAGEGRSLPPKKALAAWERCGSGSGTAAFVGRLWFPTP